MKPGMFQNQQLRQEMKLAPRMMQALRFLQAPLPELRELVRTELEQNPVLEEKAGDSAITTSLGSVPRAASPVSVRVR